MIVTFIETADHIDSVTMEAHEQNAQGFCVDTGSKAILFYNQTFELFLISYVSSNLDLEEVRIGVFNRFRELDDKQTK